MTISVAVALSDRLELRLAVHMLTTAGFEVTVATADAAALLARSSELPADVTVMSYELDVPQDGLIGPLLRTGTRVLVVGSKVAAEDVSLALLNGASGFLDLTSSSPDELATAVTDVAAGAASLHPGAAHFILEQWRQLRRNPAPNSTVTLTDREREILDGLAQGAAVKQIARRLGIAEKTVEAHKTRLYSKLRVSSQGQAVSEGLRLGLVADHRKARPEQE